MNMINKDIGKRLTEFRKKNNLTQENMAEILNVSVNHYGTIERGATAISIDKVVLLKKRFNIDLNYLVMGECSKKNAEDDTEYLGALEQIKDIIDNTLQ